MSAEVSILPDQNAGSGYDRVAIVASITRYYELLSGVVGIKPADIERPKGRA